MGREARCRASWRGNTGEGKALLETSSVLFRVDLRFEIPFDDIRHVEAAEGRLRLAVADGEAVFHLGAEARKWAERILHPPTLLGKLGVKPGMSVYLECVDAGALGMECAPALGKNHDLVFLGAETISALKRLHVLARRIRPEGAVWVVYPKGVTAIRQADVIAASKAAGLVDVKVASFSETRTALKLVIPASRRKLIPRR